MKRRKQETDTQAHTDERGEFVWTPTLNGTRWEPMKLRKLAVVGIVTSVGPSLESSAKRPSFSQVQAECDERNAGKARALWRYITRNPLSVR